MTFRKILVLPLAVLVAASSLSAFQAKPVDVTGLWTGTATGESNGQKREMAIDVGRAK